MSATAGMKRKKPSSSFSSSNARCGDGDGDGDGAGCDPDAHWSESLPPLPRTSARSPVGVEEILMEEMVQVMNTHYLWSVSGF